MKERKVTFGSKGWPQMALMDSVDLMGISVVFQKSVRRRR